MVAMAFDATFWATVALVIFFAILVWLKVPGQIAAILDRRSDRIRDELDEARKLREEAQEVLAEYQRKRQAAEKEAEAIVAAAKHEAELLAVDAAKRTEEFVNRRRKLAETKIAQAETQAVAEVKAAAVDLAIAAARAILAERVTGKSADDLFSRGVNEVKSRLH
jgi:F-type H+-transporting ATPase subunit b